MEENFMNQVKIWEELITIPTYEVGDPDKNPMFLEKRVYQGSTGKVYPYPTTDKISHEKTDKEYKAIYLENKYLKVMILPEMGGRIQRAYDKTNDYDFVYYNHVIKPALVGLLGPWISGGIEFNWPQHHRPTTFQPVDYLIKHNEDGSKSLWINDIDQMYGTKGAASFTLYPDKSYIEISGQLYNRTSLPQTFLWWANPAVPANDHTQSIFPPDVHSVYDHGKRDVSRFPIATGEYYKYDYSEGVDISRYKNIKVPTSYMAERSDYDFVGSYDHQKRAGILHVADHHISPGKKQWTWGNGDFGRAWDRNLTDEDGPYVELMTGVYTDNQPDFTWLKPFEEKTFKQYFMPYKEVGEVKNASIHAMVNIEVTQENIDICVYSTGEYDSKVVLTHKDQVIYTKEVSISPTQIFKDTVVNEGYDALDLKVSVYSGEKLLVEYQEIDQGIPELAQPAKAALPPKEIKTTEELFLNGQHIEQYRHATFLPEDYYLEGLNRDEYDIRLNNAYGVLLLRRAQFELAQTYFEKALERLTELNPNPYDSETYYNLGLSQFYQNNLDDAFASFYKATWTNEQQEMSFYYLAVIESRRHNYEEALEFVNKGLIKNAHNIKARALKAVLLRKLNKKHEAQMWLDANLSVDSFDYVSHFEKTYYNRDATIDEINELMRYDHESYLLTAIDYGEAGFYEEALKVLNQDISKKPMIHYYRSFYLRQLARSTEAVEAVEFANQCDPTYTFPNKLEDVAVLTSAIEIFEKGSKAYYYLANLYYDKKRYDEAITMWQTSIDLDDTYPTAYRNLSLAIFNKEADISQATKLMEKAFNLDQSDARVFLEMTQLMTKNGMTQTDKLALYEAHEQILKERDDVYTDYVTLLNSLGQYERALDAIGSYQFRAWEGAEGKIPAQYKLALKELSLKALEKNEVEKAKELIERAFIYPSNLNEGKLEGTKDNHLYFTSGLIYKALKDEAKAIECFNLATLGHDEPAGMMYYYDQPADMILYQALAYEQLNELGEANKRFYRLIDYGERHVYDEVKYDYFAVSIPDFQIFEEDLDAKNKAHCYYLMGLGHLGLKNYEESVKFFDKALVYDPNHQNCLLYKEKALQAN